MTVGTLTGTWDVAVVSTCTPNPYTASLTQTGGSAVGNFLFGSAWCNVPAGSTAITDPAQPGTIDASGVVRIRVKVGIFTDFEMRGTMASTGRVITGGLFNSGWTGHPFTATKR